MSKLFIIGSGKNGEEELFQVWMQEQYPEIETVIQDSMHDGLFIDGEVIENIDFWQKYCDFVDPRPTLRTALEGKGWKAFQEVTTGEPRNTIDYLNNFHFPDSNFDIHGVEIGENYILGVDGPEYREYVETDQEENKTPPEILSLSTRQTIALEMLKSKSDLPWLTIDAQKIAIGNALDFADLFLEISGEK